MLSPWMQFHKGKTPEGKRLVPGFKAYDDKSEATGPHWLRLRMLRLRAWQEELRKEIERQVGVRVGGKQRGELPL